MVTGGAQSRVCHKPHSHILLGCDSLQVVLTSLVCGQLTCKLVFQVCACQHYGCVPAWTMACRLIHIVQCVHVCDWVVAALSGALSWPVVGVLVCHVVCCPVLCFACSCEPLGLGCMHPAWVVTKAPASLLLRDEIITPFTLNHSQRHKYYLMLGLSFASGLVFVVLVDLWLQWQLVPICCSILLWLAAMQFTVVYSAVWC